MKRSNVDLLGVDPLATGFFRFERVRYRIRTFAGPVSPELRREMLRVGRSVLVLPYDPTRDVVCLIEQFRLGAYLAGREACWQIEVAAGLVEDGETEAEAARREVVEETGFDPARLLFVRSWLASPGVTDELVSLFVAEIDADRDGTIHGVASENEDIRVRLVPAAEASTTDFLAGVDNAHTLIALLDFARRRASLLRAWGAGPA